MNGGLQASGFGLRGWTFVALAAFVMLGCSEAAAPSPSTGEPWRQTPTGKTPGRLDPVGRQAKRVSIAQLRVSIPQLFGGLTWTSGTGNESMFDQLSRTLGEPDYLEVTRENRDITPLFLKFMSDMAGQVCRKAVFADRDQSDEQKRVLMRHADVNTNLRWLKLKFLQIDVAADDKDGIRHLRRVYDATLAATKYREKGWEAVCVALLTSREFLTY